MHSTFALGTQTVRDVKEKLSYIAVDFDTEMKAATESSDKEKTYALPDGNIDFKEAKSDFKEDNITKNDNITKEDNFKEDDFKEPINFVCCSGSFTQQPCTLDGRDTVSCGCLPSRRGASTRFSGCQLNNCELRECYFWDPTRTTAIGKSCF